MIDNWIELKLSLCREVGEENKFNFFPKRSFDVNFGFHL